MANMILYEFVQNRGSTLMRQFSNKASFFKTKALGIPQGLCCHGFFICSRKYS